MRDITHDERAAILAKYPKAKPIAVHNFLMTLSANQNALYASMNLGSDARSYRWNEQTVNAIKEGIRLGQH